MRPAARAPLCPAARGVPVNPRIRQAARRRRAADLGFFRRRGRKDNYTGDAIEAIGGAGQFRACKVDVVVGESHPRREEIAAQSERHGFACHVQTPRMAELIAAADLAIGAGGTAVWERCCLGLPALVSCALRTIKAIKSPRPPSAGLLYAPDRKL
jgi:UDP-2,4-diacetamido-2,4,6-trideoxy-beta-L-altropyranose hydrolase